MIIQVDGRQSDEYLVLGIQTNLSGLDDAIRYKALAWKPKKAKSYTVTHVRHLTADGLESESPTGCANIHVAYYTTTTEGEISIARKDYDK